MGYLEILEIFNKQSGFTIVYPKNTEILGQLEIFAHKLEEMIPALERYESMTSKGYFDDNLSTELALFVMHVNQVSLGLMPVSVLHHY